MMLKHAGQSLQAPDSVHSSDAATTTADISRQSLAVFEEIEGMLDKVQLTNGDKDSSQSHSLPERFRRCFKKQRVTYLLAHLEALKLSLLLLVQVLQHGKLLVTKRKFPHWSANDIVQQERAEIQNMVIVRYWSTNRLDRLHDLAVREALDENTHEKDGISTMAQHAAKNLEPSSPSTALVKHPMVSLGDLDRSLAPIKESPKDMVQTSAKVIDPLILRWTRAHSSAVELSADQKHHYRPRSLHVSFESDNDDDDGYDQAKGPDIQGYYLEGTTSDWRKPQSQEARKHASKLRKEYSAFQARVDSDSDQSSDEDVGVQRPVAKATSAAVPRGVNSDSEVWGLGRQDSGIGMDNRDSKEVVNHPRGPVHENNPYASQWSTQRPGPSSDSPRTMPRSIPQPLSIPSAAARAQNYPPGASLSPHSRPLARTSSANPQYHNPQPSPPGGWPSSHPPPVNAPQFHPHSAPHPGYLRPYFENPQFQAQHRPSSRHSNRSSSSQHRRDASRDSARDSTRDRHKSLKRSATKGLLGAGAIAGFLEALETLVI
ncbi:hypothetical protein AJ80_07554 [Polytolypa hystricis UAMH7299]|uniref:Uncharacterized protein n=1 Tax=Polytolypa hystricis (strain UAMH7299) TaxID=1447883 RepID=A0A2B7XMN6_POLH7|nr:hypothetical protein AJ80_07554 [Polytolypa hystricis UAMH7299]